MRLVKFEVLLVGDKAVFPVKQTFYQRTYGDIGAHSTVNRNYRASHRRFVGVSDLMIRSKIGFPYLTSPI